MTKDEAIAAIDICSKVFELDRGFAYKSIKQLERDHRHICAERGSDQYDKEYQHWMDEFDFCTAARTRLARHRDYFENDPNFAEAVTRLSAAIGEKN